MMQTAMRNLFRGGDLHRLNAAAIEDRFAHVIQFDALNLHLNRRAPLPTARHDSLDVPLHRAGDQFSREQEQEQEWRKQFRH